MSKLYIFEIAAHGRSAANKGTIYAPSYRKLAEVKCVVARDAGDAYKQIAAAFQPDDQRPLAGKSYLKPSKDWGHLQETPEWLPYIGFVVAYYSDRITRDQLLEHTCDEHHPFRAIPYHISKLIRDMR